MSTTLLIETVVDVVMEIKDEKRQVVLELATPDGQLSTAVEVEQCMHEEFNVRLKFLTEQGAVHVLITPDDLEKILKAAREIEKAPFCPNLYM